ncbi:harmonin-like isoform X2 [Limulus polyphemus]|uniref:Harmonin-like isoform X2 n=1 Tax=Limulus polyphemus TaxID=6850 RepID=A0ABM1SNB1_LIMPO|nr:harmonin-like isoform X2 [Limulus polyphemus]
MPTLRALTRTVAFDFASSTSCEEVSPEIENSTHPGPDPASFEETIRSHHTYKMSHHISDDQQMKYKLVTPYAHNHIRMVHLRRRGNTSLGFSIRGGLEHGTGIFVSEVQAGSEAQRKGLRIGDQLVRVNGYTIDQAVHEEVYALLRSQKTLLLRVKSVGMIPVKKSSHTPLTNMEPLHASIRRFSLPSKLQGICSTPLQEKGRFNDHLSTNHLHQLLHKRCSSLPGKQTVQDHFMATSLFEILELSEQETDEDQENPQAAKQERLRRTQSAPNDQEAWRLSIGSEAYLDSNSSSIVQSKRNDCIGINEVSKLEKVNQDNENEQLRGSKLQNAEQAEQIGNKTEAPSSVTVTFVVKSDKESSNKEDPLTWKLVNPELSPSGSILDGSHSLSSGNSSFEEAKETKIQLSSIGASGIGCSIAKGPPEMPGIYIQTVKPGGLAEKAGLQVGDQIIEMNEDSFLKIKFSEAVALLKSSKTMDLTVRKGAGLDLFPEEKTKNYQHYGNSSKPGEDEISKLSSLQEQSGLSDRDSGVIGHSSLNGKAWSSPSSSSSSRNRINGFTSESEQDFSLAEVEEDTQVLEEVEEDARMLEEARSLVGSHSDVCKQSSIASSNGFLDLNERIDIDRLRDSIRQEEEQTIKNQEAMLAKERQKIEEEHRKLLLEAERIAEERRKLEEEKKRFDTVGSLPKRPFLADINKLAERRRSTDSTDTSNTSSPDWKMRSKQFPAENKKSEEQFIRKKQHEKLMEEFRIVHKKMFGSTDSGILAENKSEQKNSSQLQSQASISTHAKRQQGSNTCTKLPPPLTQSVSLPLATLSDGNTGHQQLEHESDTRGPELAGLRERRYSSYVPPLVSNPFMFVDPTSFKSTTSPTDHSTKVTIQLRKPVLTSTLSPPISTHTETEPAITDSRDSKPKCPDTYFDYTKPKPLVSINSYKNPMSSNRFTQQNGECKQDKKSYKEHLDSTSTSSSSSVSSSPLPNKSKMQITLKTLSSTSSSTYGSTPPHSPVSSTNSVSSNQSSGPPSVTVKVTTRPADPGNLVNGSGKPTVNGSGHPTLRKVTSNFQSSKLVPEDLKFRRRQRPPTPIEEKLTSKEFNEEETGGREVKTLVVKKTGALNLSIEGGINSKFDGKIVVADMWVGGAVSLNGELEKGDQLLMVDNTKLLGMSLTFANAALRNAMSSTDENLRLTFVKRQE